MAWNLSGELIESCSCNVLCPCWFGTPELMKMDQGWCDSALVFRIDAGQADGQDVAGRTVVLAIDLPGPTMFDGNGTARVYVDDGATDEQRAALEAIFQGKKGGPMEIIGGLVANWLPTESSKIGIEDDGDTCTVSVAGAGEVRSQVLKNEAGNAMTLKDSGFAVFLNFDDATFKVAPSGSRWSDTAMPRGFETKSGARARWTWAA